MHLTVKNRTTLFIVGLGLANVAVLAFVVYPIVSSIKELHKKTYDLRLTLEERSERTQKLHASFANIGTIDKNTNDFDSYLFHKGDELALIKLLESMAAKNHLTQVVNSSNLDSKNNRFVELSLAVTGNYFDLWPYLSDLRRTVPFFVIIKDARVGPTANRDNPDASGREATLSLDIRIYVSTITPQ